MTTPMTTEQMLTELSITFPALWKRRLSEFGPDYAGAQGVWTGQDGGHLMQDGYAIFNSLQNGAPPYNGRVHEAFEAWLENRGWYCECYDGCTHFLLPMEET